MELKSKMTISELRDYVKSKDIIEILAKAEAIDEDEVNSARKMCCPFHDENTPSFHFNEDYYYCFGCGATGDAFKFLEEAYDISFMEACNLLAEKLEVELASNGPTNPFMSSSESSVPRKKLEKEWQKYLETAKQLKPEYKKFISNMFPLEVGFDPKINYYVFRYTSKTNKTLGFTKRRAFDIDDSIPGEKARHPKWKHSSVKDSLIGECANIFNLGNAVKHIRDSKEVILVEGAKDVIPWILTNHKNVVGISGTHHIGKVFETLPEVSKVILSLDSDAAGYKGILDATIYLSTKMPIDSIYAVSMDGLDPYDYYQENDEMPKPIPILDFLKRDDRKLVHSKASEWNKEAIVEHLCTEEGISYEAAKSFFTSNENDDAKAKEKQEDEISKLMKSKDEKALLKLKLKYGIG